MDAFTVRTLRVEVESEQQCYVVLVSGCVICRWSSIPFTGPAASRCRGTHARLLEPRESSGRAQPQARSAQARGSMAEEQRDGFRSRNGALVIRNDLTVWRTFVQAFGGGLPEDYPENSKVLYDYDILSALPIE